MSEVPLWRSSQDLGAHPLPFYGRESIVYAVYAGGEAGWRGKPVGIISLKI